MQKWVHEMECLLWILWALHSHPQEGRGCWAPPWKLRLSADREEDKDLFAHAIVIIKRLIKSSKYPASLYNWVAVPWSSLSIIRRNNHLVIVNYFNTKLLKARTMWGLFDTRAMPVTWPSCNVRGQKHYSHTIICWKSQFSQMVIQHCLKQLLNKSTFHTLMLLVKQRRRGLEVQRLRPSGHQPGSVCHM